MTDSALVRYFGIPLSNFVIKSRHCLFCIQAFELPSSFIIRASSFFTRFSERHTWFP